ncbi:hypothetical protein FDI24_gp064 [Acidovorax phage ACP17]|uniref:Uncharacterized protein n=1 Tax=Acidovorax phage ACP17 TaxID=2010329 RepID=A0A223AIZ1_9CAUD|nr:hypothetical protein FDI24_gp064 [Acidovorax phage ACP17]ASS33929.1 hypothetical protein [Acidovorax phage ACP17]
MTSFTDYSKGLLEASDTKVPFQPGKTVANKESDAGYKLSALNALVTKVHLAYDKIPETLKADQIDQAVQQLEKLCTAADNAIKALKAHK